MRSLVVDRSKGKMRRPSSSAPGAARCDPASRGPVFFLWIGWPVGKNAV
ncbi:MAG: hypothetical protein HSCHL_2224 [Hydrogenibacillus schlegelii]|uniref:Uncharacterized protein n=1 Tax=Hydrogenibacillus schlegelii TaxID=1484 RepID=A0A2T5GEN1_HYDSH|nr:MAG: hypothetical protein HSCHL_2224 [Hydrogenibacillus schlegelii]